MRIKSLVSTLAILTALAGCDQTGQSTSTPTESNDSMSDDVVDPMAVMDADASAVLEGLAAFEAPSAEATKLLSAYDGPYQGVPHFDEMDLAC